MERTFFLDLHPEMSSDSAWIVLQSHEIDVLYAEEDENLKRLVIKTFLTPEEILERFAFVRKCEETILPKIDWEADWQLHAPGFSEGKLSLDLKPFGKDKMLYLIPGAGFGNLSHPTTRLVLELMKGKVEGRDLVDIGSGSGVLALAACALGARSVMGIDIDPVANDHASENALLNGLTEVKFYLPDAVPAFNRFSGVVLMNMIQAEQKQAWESFTKKGQISGIALTSGILKQQEEEYKSLVMSWGWKVEQVVEEDGWLGFYSYISS